MIVKILLLLITPSAISTQNFTLVPIQTSPKYLNVAYNILQSIKFFPSSNYTYEDVCNDAASFNCTMIITNRKTYETTHVFFDAKINITIKHFVSLNPKENHLFVVVDKYILTWDQYHRWINYGVESVVRGLPQALQVFTKMEEMSDLFRRMEEMSDLFRRMENANISKKTHSSKLVKERDNEDSPSKKIFIIFSCILGAVIILTILLVGGWYAFKNISSKNKRGAKAYTIDDNFYMDQMENKADIYEEYYAYDLK